MAGEKVIDLRELLYFVLKKWRKIIILGIIFGILIGLNQLRVEIKNMKDPAIEAAAQEAYAAELSTYHAREASLREEIDRLQVESERQTEYNENSMLMKIDAMNKFVGSFDVYIDSKYQIDPNLSYQNIDLTTRLVSAYYSYLNSYECYNSILGKTDVVSEIRFLTEILSASSNDGAAVVTVSCVADTEEHVRELLDVVESCIAVKYPSIQAAIGEHDYAILMESKYSTIDWDLEQTQKSNRQVVIDNGENIASNNEELVNLAEQGEPVFEFNYDYRSALLDSAKYACVGNGIVVLLVTIFFAGVYLWTRKITGNAIWDSLGVVVLGTVYTQKKRACFYKIDRWIERIMGFRAPEISMAESCALASANLCAALKKQDANSASLVSIVGDELTARVVESMRGEAGKFNCIGNVLSDREAVEKFSSAEKVMLLVEEGKNTIDEVERIKTLASACGKELLGALVIK